MYKNENIMFVSDISVNGKQIKHSEELAIINNVRERLLFIIIEENIEEAKKICREIINDETGNAPIKGNITYSVIPAVNGTDIEIVRHSHGGGNNASVRITGGVVIATVKTVPVKGKLSPIHGFTWYHPEELSVTI